MRECLLGYSRPAAIRSSALVTRVLCPRHLAAWPHSRKMASLSTTLLLMAIWAAGQASRAWHHGAGCLLCRLVGGVLGHASLLVNAQVPKLAAAGKTMELSLPMPDFKQLKSLHLR